MNGRSAEGAAEGELRKSRLRVFIPFYVHREADFLTLLFKDGPAISCPLLSFSLSLSHALLSPTLHARELTSVRELRIRRS